MSKAVECQKKRGFNTTPTMAYSCISTPTTTYISNYISNQTHSTPSISFKFSPFKFKSPQNRTSSVHSASTDTATPIEKSFPAIPAVLDINRIRNILPHRYPFLLVDRVVEFNPGVSAVAIKNVTINDNFFPGHFPKRPIMPGVLMVEAMAQVGGIVMLKPEAGGSRENFVFAGIDKVRFRKPVIAGDTLVMRMTLLKLQKRFGVVKMEGIAYVGDEVVCEGEFMMALGNNVPSEPGTEKKPVSIS